MKLIEIQFIILHSIVEQIRILLLLLDGINLVNVLFFFPNHEYFIRIHKQETGYLDDHFKYINLPEIKEDDIFQLTLEYGRSKVELSDELYEFIFGENSIVI